MSLRTLILHVISVTLLLITDNNLENNFTRECWSRFLVYDAFILSFTDNVTYSFL